MEWVDKLSICGTARGPPIGKYGLKTMHLLLAALITRLQDKISRNLGSTAGRRKRFVPSPKPPERLLVPLGLSNGRE